MKFISQIFSILAILAGSGFSILLLASQAPPDMLTAPSIIVTGGLIGLAISTK